MNPLTALCKVEGCDRPPRYKASGMCQKHHWRMREHGSTDKPVRRLIPRAQQIQWGLERGLKAAVEVGGCLEWQGKFTCKGATPVVAAYDIESCRTENTAVPRMLWEAKNGQVPPGKLVFRTCCNRACVLEDHLACGTRKDWAKARKKAGATKHKPATLIALTLAARRRADIVNTMDKARAVRSLKAAGARVADIAAQTGVHPTMVAEIGQGRSWRELGGNPFIGLVEPITTESA